MEENSREPSGVLIVDKHAGATSHDIVNAVRRIYNTRRVGHTGTLDPMATGVLVVLVGRAAKAAEYLSADRKHYLATLRLGLTTDTEDTTGKILTESDNIPSPDAIIAACARFTGKIMQTPPMYSALKVGGKKLCDLARAGGFIEREPRQIEIFNITCSPTGTLTDFTLDVTCSSGTYIRTLCADIGANLGCGGVMASLRRLEAGGFNLEPAVTVDQLKTYPKEKLESLLLPVESLFSDLPEICLPVFYEKLCRSGCEIYQKKIRTSLPIGQRVRLSDAGGSFFALGEAREYPDGSALKALKLFELG
jgi:tRNA pseudouridine55 synthase